MAGFVEPSLKSTLAHFVMVLGGTVGFLFGGAISQNGQTAARNAHTLNRDIGEFAGAAGQPSLVGVPLADLMAPTIDVQAEPKGD